MILADTHVVLRLALDPQLVSSAALKALSEARLTGDGVAISDITLWEIASLTKKGRIVWQTPVSSFLQSVEATYKVLRVTAAIAQRGIEFSDAYPRDPADRLIGATAMIHGLQLVTSDKGIHDSKEVDCIW